MKLLAVVLCGVVVLLADSPRIRYAQLKAEARAAYVAADLSGAEAKYRELLLLTQDLQPGPYEVYAEVVTPLAQIYRAQKADEKLENLLRSRIDAAHGGLELGLAQADLGFHLQNSEISADRFHGEQMVEASLRTFEDCAAGKAYAEHCARRLAETACVQGAIFFQQLRYDAAEPLFRRVVGLPEQQVQKDVLILSIHALRGILVHRKQFPEARQLDLRAAALEAKHPESLMRLRFPSERTRAQ